MKFSAKKLMSLVFAAGLAASATFINAEGGPVDWSGTARSAVVTNTTHNGGTVHVTGADTGRDYVFWCLHVTAEYETDEALPRYTWAPIVRVTTATGDYKRRLTCFDNLSKMGTRTMISYGHTDEKLEADITAMPSPYGPQLPVILRVEVRRCSTREIEHYNGDILPIVNREPQDSAKKPLVQTYRFGAITD
ncbi:MAG: hypothetical protein LBJ95_02200 [Oscillospiraceae bacterium]|nr:hypothetical protein [Oscillospiraceae bacterium]